MKTNQSRGELTQEYRVGIAQAWGIYTEAQIKPFDELLIM